MGLQAEKGEQGEKGEKGDKGDKGEVDYYLTSNALKGNKFGNSLVLDDVSPLPHTLSVSVRSKNILPYPFKDQTKTTNGITFTDNGDGTVTANGTATATANFMCRAVSTLLLKKGSYILTSGIDNDNAGVTLGVSIGYKYDGEARLTKPTSKGKVILTLEEDAMCDVICVIRQGQTVENLVFKPQLEVGVEETEFSVYTDISGANVIKDNECFPVAESGAVEGITSQYPTTVLKSDKAGTVVEAEYNRDINRAFAQLQTAVNNLIGV